MVDPAYPSQALYHYDIGVTCPRDLSVTFTVPTADGAEFDKRLDVTLTDSHRAVTLRVMRPASRPTPKTTGESRAAGRALRGGRVQSRVAAGRKYGEFSSGKALFKIL